MALSKPSGVLVLLCSVLGAADLPIQQVTIYKNGVALFERSGTVPVGEAGKLEFRTGDMNDVLKSLIIVDAEGHRINSVRYDSNETLAQRLNRFPFSVGSGDLLSQFLDRFKGAAIELKTPSGAMKGTILGARAIHSGEADKKAEHEQVTLLLGSGEFVTVDLGAVSSFSFTDPKLQEQLKQYLQAVNESRSQDKRSVYIDTANNGAQNMRISYVLPAAIWKSSYRLTLGGAKSTVEGWAIIDNTTDEDWKNIRLSVVSGRPVSFISQLDTPRYGKRVVAELPEDAAAGPVIYGDALSTGDAGGSGGGGGVIAENFGGGTFRAPQAKAAPGVVAQSVRVAPAPSSSTVVGATGGTLGELFEYRFDQPITVNRNQSAMIPFVQDQITARKLLIFDNSGSEHPVNAAELTNSTGKTLDGGPLTVFEGGAYAGEALIETVKAGDKRLIGYAVDYGTRVTTAFNSGQQQIREVHASDGVLRLRYANREKRTYTINNVDAKPKTLMLQQEGVAEYTVLSPKPSERTATAYRFEVALEAGKSRTFEVQQERVSLDTTMVTDTTPDFMLTLVQNKQISDNGRRQLQAVIALKQKLADVGANLGATESRMKDLTSDGNRIRQNIDSLNRVSGQEQQVRQYAAQLGTNETELAHLRDTQKTLAQQRTAAEADIRKAIAALDF